MNNELTMDDVKECLLLLAKAAERITVNTYMEQGAVAADEVFQTLDKVEKLIAERSENGKGSDN